MACRSVRGFLVGGMGDDESSTAWSLGWGSAGGGFESGASEGVEDAASKTGRGVLAKCQTASCVVDKRGRRSW